jgi:erythromycin esterase
VAGPTLGLKCVIHRLLMLSLAVGSVACGSASPPDQLGWIRSHAIPLETSEAGHGFEDLAPLKAVVGDAHIVSLGECTHGTREVFQMKHRLVEYLASQQGFTIFSIEANMPEAYRLNEYVLDGKGDPKELIAGMYFWTWNTEEVLAMVEWMRRFNESGKGRIEFTGFDMQTPDVAMDVVVDFLKKADPQRVARVEDTYRSLRKGAFRSGRRKSLRIEDTDGGKTGAASTGPDPELAAKACGEIVAQLEASRDRYLTTTTAKEVEWAIQNARVVHQCLRLEAGETPRDESMATNVKWILDHAQKGTKIVLWAHNGHVGRQGARGGSMGSFLDKWYGKDQVVIGFSAGDGRYTAIKQGAGLRNDNRLHPPINDSFEENFRASGLPIFALDLRNAREDDPASSWLTRQHNFRSIGALATSSQFWPTNIRGLYDAIIYLDKTTASRSLPGAGTKR